MPEKTEYETELKLGSDSTGLVQGVNKAKEAVKGLGKETKETAEKAEKGGEKAEKGFKLFEIASELAKEQVNKLKEAIMDIAPELVGITAAFEVFHGVTSQIDDSVKAFVAYRTELNALKGTIAGTDLVKKHGGDEKEILSQYLGNSKEMAEEQGKLFSQNFYTGIQANLAKAGVGPGLSKELTKNLVTFTAFTKQTLDISEGDVTQYTTMIKRAIDSGNMGRLGQQFGLNTAQAKKFKEVAKSGNLEAEIALLLQGSNFKKAAEFIKTLGETEDGELKRLKTSSEETAQEVGAAWAPFNEAKDSGLSEIQTQWGHILAEVGNVVTQLAGPIKAGMIGFANGLQTASFWVTEIYRYIVQNWTTMFDVADIQAKWKELAADPNIQSIIATVKSWGKTFDDDVAPSVRAVWTLFDRNLTPALKIIEAVDFAELKFAIWGLKLLFDALNAVVALTVNLMQTLSGHPDNTKQLADNAKAMRDSALQSIAPEHRAEWQAKAAEKEARLDAIRSGSHKYENMGGPLYQVPTTTNAKGGITTGASMGLIGEAGPELIYPLTDPNVLNKSLEEAKKASTLGKTSADLQKAQLDQLTLISQQSTAMGGGAAGAGGGGDVPQGSMGGRTLGSFGYIGDATPDSNSLKGVGAYSSHMIPGYSAGMSSGAQAKWGIRPGQTFTIAGHTFRLDDTDNSGGQLDYVDVYNPFHAPDPGHGGDANRILAGHPESYWFSQRMGSGGIVSSATRALLGESGKEAVIPLSSGSLAKHGLGGHFAPTFSPNITVNGAGADVAEHIRDVLQNEFESFMNNAYFEFQRRKLG